MSDDTALCACCGDFHPEAQTDEPDSLCACCGEDHADQARLTPPPTPMDQAAKSGREGTP